MYVYEIKEAKKKTKNNNSTTSGVQEMLCFFVGCVFMVELCLCKKSLFCVKHKMDHI